MLRVKLFSQTLTFTPFARNSFKNNKQFGEYIYILIANMKRVNNDKQTIHPFKNKSVN